MSLFEELKRRNVFRVGIAYGVAAWLLLQLTDIVTPILELPDSIPRMVLFLLVIGFIPAVILAWAFELTPDGVKLESEVDRSNSITSKTGRKLDRIIIVVLIVAVVFLLFDKFTLETESEPASPANAGIQAGPGEIGSPPDSKYAKNANQVRTRKSVAVLPFVAMSNGPDDDYFSDGLTEEIINALTQLPELLVTARTSAFYFKGQNIPISEIATQLGVAHVVEGSVRRAGEQLRITAQLIRAADGFHLWSETYDRRTEDTLAVQEDIAEKIALALDLILDDEQRERMRRVGVRNVEAFTAYQKGVEFYTKAHGEGDQISHLRLANLELAKAISFSPDFADAYIVSSDLHTHMLLSHANGELDGQITEEDLQQAPVAIRANYDQALQNVKDNRQRAVVNYDRSLLLGEWRGLAMLSDRALTTPGCRVALWAQLGSGAFGRAQSLLDAYKRVAICDPMRSRSWLDMVRASLWLGLPEQAIRIAETGLKSAHHDWVMRAYILALYAAGRVEEASEAASTRVQSESDMLFIKAQLASMNGDKAAAQSWQEQYLGKFGPNDMDSLMLAASQGDRNEANRLAGLIDRRPFGYMVLMLTIYLCTCGAPFDLESTPVFASMLSESGLTWPPSKPIEFPLKDW
jgi:adenylate cyclase